MYLPLLGRHCDGKGTIIRLGGPLFNNVVELRGGRALILRNLDDMAPPSEHGDALSEIELEEARPPDPFTLLFKYCP